MRVRLWIALVVVSQFSSNLTLASNQASAETMPSVIQGSREVYFVAADSLETRGAKVVDSRVPEDFRELIEALASVPQRGDCVRLIPGVADTNPPIDRRTLAKAAKDSEGVLRARVTGVEPGFRSTGSAGSLVRVTAIEVVSGSWLSVGESYYFFIPIGNFTFLGRPYCAEAPDWVGLPSIESEVLLFLPYRGWTDGQFLEVVDGRGLIILPPGEGQVRAPSGMTLGFAAMPSSEELLNSVRIHATSKVEP